MLMRFLNWVDGDRISISELFSLAIDRLLEFPIAEMGSVG